MPRTPKSTRYALVAFLYTVGALALIFILMVVGRSALKTMPVQAASTTLYPKFCLGGWSDPQHAAGGTNLLPSDPVQSYTADNSAVLESGVSAQLFCGYFAGTERSHPPSKVAIRFQWTMKSISGAEAESLSSFSPGQTIATTTGLKVSETPAPQTTTSVDNPPVTPPPSSEIPPVPAAATTTESVSTTSPQTQPEQASPPPASQTPPASATSSESQSVATSTTSFLWNRLMGLIAETALAASSDPSQSNSPFLQVSYSVDGVRWTVVGTVGLDNWKDYRVSVPVSSWTDVSNLQVMLSVMPSLDKKPDIYLDSLSAEVAYDRSVGDVVSDAIDAASNTLDAAVASLTGSDNKPQQPPAPREVTIVTKKLIFSADKALDESRRKGNDSVKASASSDGASLTISGPCSKKYYVVMIFKNPTDYADKPGSALSNGAWECENGSFSYDISAMSPDTPPGSYYLVTGEENDTGPWTPVSPVYPIAITGSTTQRTVLQP